MGLRNFFKRMCHKYVKHPLFLFGGLANALKYVQLGKFYIYKF